jgi:acetyl-CoA carboxylase carboxyl transferase subunit alpha
MCAQILWKDTKKAVEAAQSLCLTAQDLLAWKIIDEIIPEPPGGAHRDHEAMAMTLKEALLRHLQELEARPADELVAKRLDRYRQIGVVW